MKPPLRARVLSGALQQLVARGLRGVWVRGELPSTSTIWAANHHSWWDGFVAGAVLGSQHRTATLLMQGENLTDFRFLSEIGVISTQRPRQALQALRDGRVLVIYPEGDLRPPGPLCALAPGAAWFAEHAPAALVPVALRVLNRGHQYPEAFVDIGPPVPSDQLTVELAQRLAELDATLLKTDPRDPPNYFQRVVNGRRSWDERISRWSAKVSR